MRTSSNPAFRNLPRGAAGAPYAGFGQPYGQPGYGPPTGYGAPQAPSGEASRPMTVDDVVMKTGASLGVTLLVGVVTAIWAQTQAASGTMGPIVGAMIAGMLVGLVLSLIIIFKQLASAPMTLAYAAAEGVFLGAITGVFEMLYPGIALQAILGTAAVFVVMLVVYKTGAVKVTPKFRKWMIGALGGVAVVMLVNLVLSLFGVNTGLRDGSGLAIVFSLVVIGIAAFSFLLDFDMADEAIRQGMPAKFAWFVAFGLLVTLVWLYLEILRLLSYLQND
ncbi:Bax inhibitor-1/YccA family protein [Saccharomonospora xinjiangensis]|uniref:Putative membrane protein n=1 Tax=Saccharomonospora xinjiangensis XJ-54 TaxID=882086 RepID=I0V4W2_9PSEU|nr:Bax inhibitor-1/YccA family protein [Saccharomonospora xinjiangensis]EID55165.1 putative membrane protein [Saccharomonospora xinjiangensis XJ-54]QBQ61882.1 Bax inhibitor 1 like protein [Saccharomonospora xinjiangensis]